MLPEVSELQPWLGQWLPSPIETIEPITSDASVRRYLRVFCQHSTFILMLAPPDEVAAQRFIKLAQALTALGLRVPRVVAYHPTHGAMLLDDLGDEHLLRADYAVNPAALAQSFTNYQQALQLLPHIRALEYITPDEPLPQFDAAFMQRELELFFQWFVKTHLQLTLSDAEHLMWQQCFNALIDSALAQPYAGMHRDFHGRNLLVQSDACLAVIDFQDAVRGPVTYDMVSLLKDCYIQWPADVVATWRAQCLGQLQAEGHCVATSATEFQRMLDWMGLQRHLKVLGIFARLHHRDNKSGYLADLPRVVFYVAEVLQRYSEFTDCAHWFSQQVLVHYPSVQAQLQNTQVGELICAP